MRKFHFKLRYWTLPKELNKLPRTIKFVSFIILIYYLGWGIAAPFFPIYLKEILKTYSAVGLVTGLLYFFSILWTIPLGELSDKVSKKGIISLVLLLYLPMGGIILLLKNFMHFVFFRVYHSFTSSALWTSSEAYLRQHSPKGKTAESIALFDAATGLAMVIGPLIGALLIMRIGFNLFWAISIFSLFAMLLSLKLPDRKKAGMVKGFKKVVKEGMFRKEFRDFRKIKGIKGLAIIAFFTLFVYEFLVILLPLVVREIGASYAQIGLLFAIFSVPILFEPYFSIIADRKGKRPITLNALFIGVPVFIFMFFIENLIMIYAAAFIISLCLSAIIPAVNGRITELIPKKEIGEITGGIRTIKLIGAGTGPIIAGIISDVIGINYIFVLGALVFFGMWIFILLKKKFIL